MEVSGLSMIIMVDSRRGSLTWFYTQESVASAGHDILVLSRKPRRTNVHYFHHDIFKAREFSLCRSVLRQDLHISMFVK
jgi:hypothetical protein